MEKKKNFLPYKLVQSYPSLQKPQDSKWICKAVIYTLSRASDRIQATVFS